MRVLITRPEREATALAAALSERGHLAVIAPLFHLQILHPPSDFEARVSACQAILLTSANGARALAEATHQRSRLLFAVGDTTAATAEGLGFTAVTSASGDGAALAALVRQQLDAKAAPLLHVSGTEVGFDLGEALGKDGFEVQRVALYEAREADALPASAAAALQARALDVATFFSPRASALFAELVRTAGLVDSLSDVSAVAISPAALAPLADLPFKASVAAQRPTRQAVLDEVDRLAPASVQEQLPVMTDPSPTAPPTESRTVVVRRGLGFFGSLLGGMVGALLLAVALVATVPWWLGLIMDLWHRGEHPPASGGEVIAGIPHAVEELRHELGSRVEELDKRLKALAATTADKPGGPDPVIAELRRKVEALENRPLPSAPTMPAPPAAATPAGPNPDTEKEITSLQREMASLRTALQTLDQTVAAQREQAKSLSDQARSLNDTLSARSSSEQKVLQAARAAAVIGVAARLSSALELGLPFAEDLALLSPLVQGDAKLTEISGQLQPQAQTGVAPRAALAREFPAVAKAVLAQDLADDSFGQRVLGKLRSLVSLRRVGDVPGDAVDAKLARAEVALNQGNLAKAVELVKSLPANVADAASAWLGRAEAHLAAEQAVDRLSAYAVQLLGHNR